MSKMVKDKLVEILLDLESEGDKVDATRFSYMGIEYIKRGIFDVWRNKIIVVLKQYSFVPAEIIQSILTLKSNEIDSIETVKEQINSLVDLIQKDYISCESEAEFDRTMELENIFNKFHKIARQLRSRHSSRSTLNISDEYDVQDLLHALLLLHFDDVRAEEWTPSYAGGCERMDFLLKDIQTVIEVKKTRESMSPKDLGEQLIIDIEKYQAHPECKQLYCFVYDPDGFLGNPTGIINDLESKHGDFLKVFIKPE